LKEFFLILEAADLGADNRSTGFESEYVPDEWFMLSMSLDYVCDLNNGILFGLREPAFLS